MSTSDKNNVDAQEIPLEQLGEVAGGTGRNDLIRSDAKTGHEKKAPAPVVDRGPSAPRR